MAECDGDLYDLREVLGRTAGFPSRRMVVVCPYDRATLESAVRAGAMGFVEPILLGDEKVIRRSAEENGVDLAGFTVAAAPESEVLERAGALWKEKSADFIYPGQGSVQRPP